MYPYITIGAIKIYMMGLGIVAGLATFLIVVKIYSNKRGLNFKYFLKKFPLYLIITYLLGTYSRYLINDLVIFPLNWEYLLLYLSPYGYKFHYIGVVSGIILSVYRFLKKIPHQQRPLRVSSFAHGALLALIPLGIGFVLGDVVIGQITTKGIYISAMLQDSGLAKFDKVIPLGLYISLFGLVSHMIATRYEDYTKQAKGYLIISVISIALAIFLLFQQYPRHIVTRRLGMSRDIKQYFSIAIAIWFMILYKRHKTTYIK